MSPYLHHRSPFNIIYLGQCVSRVVLLYKSADILPDFRGWGNLHELKACKRIPTLYKQYGFINVFVQKIVRPLYLRLMSTYGLKTEFVHFFSNHSSHR